MKPKDLMAKEERKSLFILSRAVSHHRLQFLAEKRSKLSNLANLIYADVSEKEAGINSKNSQTKHSNFTEKFHLGFHRGYPLPISIL